MRKKLLALAVALIVLLSMAVMTACGGDGDDPTPKTEPQTLDEVIASWGDGTVLELDTTDLPAGLVYEYGTEFDANMLRAFFKNGDNKLDLALDPSTGATVDLGGFDKNTPGTYTVTVTYKTYSATVKVTVKTRPAVETLRMKSNSPHTTTFGYSEAFECAGLAAEAVMTDGSVIDVDMTTVDIDSSTFDGFTPGDYTITVSLRADSAKKFTYTVHVSDQIATLPKEITVSAASTVKRQYGVGEDFDATGLKIQGRFGSSTEFVEVDPALYTYNSTGFNSAVVGSYVIVVYLLDCPNVKTNIPVEVMENPLYVTGIAILNPPTKLNYKKGEQFVADGLVVNIVYEGGSTAPLSANEYSVACANFDSNVAGIYTYTVTLLSDTSKTTTFDVTVLSYEVAFTADTAAREDLTDLNNCVTTNVIAGGDFTFSFKIAAAYSQNTPAVTVNGEPVQLSETDGVYSYTISAIDGAKAVAIAGMTKNSYAATIPTDDGYVIEGYSFDTVTHGEDFSFRVTLNTGYTDSVITVTAGGVTLTAVAGVYTYPDVTAAFSVTVSGVELNDVNYTLTEGTGYSFTDAEDGALESGTVKYGTELSFKVVTTGEQTYADVYSAETLLEAVNGVYTVTVTTPVTVTVEVKKAVSYVEVLSNPTKTRYFLGDAIDLDGLTYKVTYFDTATEDFEVTTATDDKLIVTGFDNETEATELVVTVQFRSEKAEGDNASNTFTLTFSMEKDDIESASIKTQPDRTECFVGDIPSLTGLVVTLTYESGKTEDVNDFSEWTTEGLKNDAEGTDQYSVGISGIANSFVTLSATFSYEFTLTFAALPDGVSVAAQGGNCTTEGVTRATTYTIALTVDTGYDAQGMGLKVDGADKVFVENEGVYTYTINGFTADVSVSVNALSLIKYNVIFPDYNAGYSIVKTNGEAFDVSELLVEYGSTISFKINLSEGYTESVPTVKINTVPLTDADGVYTSAAASADLFVTVEGVALNVYDYTVPTDNKYSFATAAGAMTSAEASHGDVLTFTVTLTDPTTGETLKVFANDVLLIETEGNYTYTVTEDTDFSVTIVKGVASVAVTTQPTKLTYYTEETIDLTDLAYLVTYTDESTDTFTVTAETDVKLSVSGFDSSVPAEDQLVTLTFWGAGNNTFTITVDIIADTISSIAVDTAPTETDYFVGDYSIDVSGLVITATYESGRQRDFSEFDGDWSFCFTNGSDEDTVAFDGATHLKITVNGCETTVNVSVTYEFTISFNNIADAHVESVPNQTAISTSIGVERGSEFVIAVKPSAGYDPQNLTLTVNSVSQTFETRTNYEGEYYVYYAYTISDINIDYDVVISTLSLYEYEMDIINNYEDGCTVDYESLSVTHGSDFTFSVSLLEGYTDCVVKATAYGEEITPVGGVYTVEDVVEDKVSVSVVLYRTLTIPYEAAEYYFISLNDNKVLSRTETQVVYLYEIDADIDFTIVMYSSYSKSPFVVRANDTALTPVINSTDSFRISGLDENVAITVEGAVLNTYALTYPVAAAYSFAASEGTVNPAAATHGDVITITIVTTDGYAPEAGYPPRLLYGNSSTTMSEVEGSSGTYTTTVTVNDDITLAVTGIMPSGKKEITFYPAEGLTYKDSDGNVISGSVFIDPETTPAYNFTVEANAGYSLDYTTGFHLSKNGYRYEPVSEYLYEYSIDTTADTSFYITATGVAKVQIRVSVEYAYLNADEIWYTGTSGLVNYGESYTVVKPDLSEDYAFVGWFASTEDAEARTNVLPCNADGSFVVTDITEQKMYYALFDYLYDIRLVFDANTENGSDELLQAALLAEELTVTVNGQQVSLTADILENGYAFKAANLDSFTCFDSDDYEYTYSDYLEGFFAGDPGYRLNRFDESSFYVYYDYTHFVVSVMYSENSEAFSAALYAPTTALAFLKANSYQISSGYALYTAETDGDLVSMDTVIDSDKTYYLVSYTPEPPITVTFDTGDNTVTYVSNDEVDDLYPTDGKLVVDNTSYQDNQWHNYRLSVADSSILFVGWAYDGEIIADDVTPFYVYGNVTAYASTDVTLTAVFASVAATNALDGYGPYYGIDMGELTVITFADGKLSYASNNVVDSAPVLYASATDTYYADNGNGEYKPLVFNGNDVVYNHVSGSRVYKKYVGESLFVVHYYTEEYGEKYRDVTATSYSDMTGKVLDEISEYGITDIEGRLYTKDFYAATADDLYTADDYANNGAYVLYVLASDYAGYTVTGAADVGGIYVNQYNHESDDWSYALIDEPFVVTNEVYRKGGTDYYGMLQQGFLSYIPNGAYILINDEYVELKNITYNNGDGIATLWDTKNQFSNGSDQYGRLADWCAYVFGGAVTEPEVIFYAPDYTVMLLGTWSNINEDSFISFDESGNAYSGTDKNNINTPGEYDVIKEEGVLAGIRYNGENYTIATDANGLYYFAMSGVNYYYAIHDESDTLITLLGEDGDGAIATLTIVAGTFSVSPVFGDEEAPEMKFLFQGTDKKYYIHNGSFVAFNYSEESEVKITLDGYAFKEFPHVGGIAVGQWSDGMNTIIDIRENGDVYKKIGLGEFEKLSGYVTEMTVFGMTSAMYLTDKEMMSISRSNGALSVQGENKAQYTAVLSLAEENTTGAVLVGTDGTRLCFEKGIAYLYSAYGELTARYVVLCDFATMTLTIGTYAGLGVVTPLYQGAADGITINSVAYSAASYPSLEGHYVGMMGDDYIELAVTSSGYFYEVSDESELKGFILQYITATGAITNSIGDNMVITVLQNGDLNISYVGMTAVFKKATQAAYECALTNDGRKLYVDKTDLDNPVSYFYTFASTGIATLVYGKTEKKFLYSVTGGPIEWSVIIHADSGDITATYSNETHLLVIGSQTYAPYESPQYSGKFVYMNGTSKEYIYIYEDFTISVNGATPVLGTFSTDEYGTFLFGQSKLVNDFSGTYSYYADAAGESFVTVYEYLSIAGTYEINGVGILQGTTVVINEDGTCIVNSNGDSVNFSYVEIGGVFYQGSSTYYIEVCDDTFVYYTLIIDSTPDEWNNGRMSVKVAFEGTYAKMKLDETTGLVRDGETTMTIVWSDEFSEYVASAPIEKSFQENGMKEIDGISFMEFVEIGDFASAKIYYIGSLQYYPDYNTEPNNFTMYFKLV